MTFSGWIFLVFSWALIFALCAFCFMKLFGLRTSNVEAPLDIDTGRGKKSGKTRKR